MRMKDLMKVADPVFLVAALFIRGCVAGLFYWVLSFLTHIKGDLETIVHRFAQLYGGG